MVQIVKVEEGGAPPVDERALVVVWRSSGVGISTDVTPQRVVYSVAPDKHRFFEKEVPHVAKRLGFRLVYFVGRPEEQQTGI